MTIGARNVISANHGGGLYMAGSGGDLIAGNYIGTDVGGEHALGNGGDGINILITGAEASGETIGVKTINGTTIGAPNFIFANHGDGVHLDSSGGDLVAGNYIGTNAGGESDLGNVGDGINILITAAGASGETIGGTTINGTTIGAPNVISANHGDGVFVQSSGGDLIAGNYIGTNAGGESALGNWGDGIFITGAANETIGGTTSGASNVISANAGAGVHMAGSSSSLIQGNYIGTNAGGESALGIVGERSLGNGYGIQIADSHGISIGGPMGGTGNTIRGSTHAGIWIDSQNVAAVGCNSVMSNVITNLDGSGAELVEIGTDDRPIGLWISNSQDNKADHNTISGFGVGVYVSGTIAQHNEIGWNVIDAGPVAEPANRPVQIGVYIDQATSNTAQGNTISGCSYGVDIDGATAKGNLLTGNHIGTQATGKTAARRAGRAGRAKKNPQLIGIAIRLAPSNSVVGNSIKGNKQAGVYVYGNSATGEQITGNTVWKGQYGILLYNAPNNGGYGELKSHNHSHQYGVAPVREYIGHAPSPRGRAKVRQAVRTQGRPPR
jgi:titin